MKNRSREYGLSFLIAVYLSLCVLLFSFFLLIWTYHSTDSAIRREITDSFGQRHVIAEIVFQERVDNIERILKDIQSDPIFSGQFQADDPAGAKLLFQEMLDRNQDYDLDLLFLCGLDGQVKIDAASPYFDTDVIISEIQNEGSDKIPLTGVRRFKGEKSDLTTVMLGIPMINRANGLVFGSLIGGYVLNSNFAIMESMRIQTRAGSLALFESGDLLGSTEHRDSPLLRSLLRARKNLLPGEVSAEGGQLISYRIATISGQTAFLEIMIAIPDHTKDLIYSLFAGKALVTILFSLLLLFLSFFIIRRMTMPSLKELLSCMESLSSGDLNTRYPRGAILEFNRIGAAMEVMAAHLESADRKRKELEHIINLSSAVVLLRETRADWPLRFVSDNIRQFGYSPEEFLHSSMTYTDMIYPEDRERVISEVRRYSQSGADEFIQEYRILTGNGEMRWIDDRTWIQRDEKGQVICYQGIILDISCRKEADREKAEMEIRLGRSKKMETMGLLAGGVAHDLNNILSGILSYPDLLLMSIPEDSKLRDPLKTIKESGERAAAVVQDLLTIARGVASSRQVISLDIIVQEYLTSPEFNQIKMLYPGVRLKSETEPDLLSVSCSVIHIRKILMNLVQNAMESIDADAGREGEILIRTENRYLDNPLERYEKIPAGEYAVLGVADNGPGIADEDIKRIFEPFYTKKKMGRSGTGLGLAVVWNTVMDHEGYISLESKENQTVFEILFPVCRGEKLRIPDSVSLEELRGNGERVLIVDDEAGQREIASGMLGCLGYFPTALSGGEEAVAYLKNHQADILLLDMLMPPGMDGMETYRRITEFRPRQKAVIASGFSESRSVRETLRLGAGQYLKKPYTLQKLGMAIRMELDR